MVRTPRPLAFVAVAATAVLATSLSACGSGSGQAHPAPAHPTATASATTTPAATAPAHAIPASQADLLTAARQSAHNPAFAHAVRSGDTHWAASKVRFLSGHYTLRTACTGDGTLTVTATGSGSWSIRCTTGQIAVDQVTQITVGRSVDFSFTAAAGVRFAAVATG
ncbi:hypothetical protein OG747_52255 (plasmid) [Streptomyces sp. NBC_01384]|uniref:hypothetical protein n=1 Tax=Streptomyces sp. NBC_01384 TaxID=2903847 RepID=UPI002F90A030